LRISPPYSINVRKSTASIPDYPPAT
jgi:hypothetical protein